MNQTSLKSRALEYIKNYIQLNLDKYTQIDLINFLKGADQEDETSSYFDNWVDEHFSCPTIQHEFSFNNCQEMAEAMNYIREKDEFNDFNSMIITVENIVASYLYNFLLKEYLK